MIPEYSEGHAEAHMLPVTFFPNLKPFGLVVGMAGAWIKEFEPSLHDAISLVAQDLYDAANAAGVEIVNDYDEQEDVTVQLTLPIAATWMVSEYAKKEFDRVSDNVKDALYSRVLPELVKMLDAALEAETGVDSNTFDRRSQN